MGIKYIEVPGYEADDIIGTFANMVDSSDKYNGLIVSSDKDLLQLISDKVTVKLLKSWLIKLIVFFEGFWIFLLKKEGMKEIIFSHLD